MKMATPIEENLLLVIEIALCIFFLIFTVIGDFKYWVILHSTDSEKTGTRKGLWDRSGSKKDGHRADE